MICGRLWPALAPHAQAATCSLINPAGRNDPVAEAPSTHQSEVALASTSAHRASARIIFRQRTRVAWRAASSLILARAQLMAPSASRREKSSARHIARAYAHRNAFARHPLEHENAREPARGGGASSWRPSRDMLYAQWRAKTTPAAAMYASCRWRAGRPCM